MASNDRLEAFAEVLGRLQRAAGLSQAGLAHLLLEMEDIRVSASAVGEWVRAESEPSRDKVFALERCLGALPGTLSRPLGYEPPDVQPIRVDARGEDLAELRQLDPEAYEAIMRQAEIALDRARGRRRRR